MPVRDGVFWLFLQAKKPENPVPDGKLRKENIMNKITLWNESEYNYAAACGFIPNMRLYFHEDEKVRPCILIAPGGGYSVVSPSEGEIVAKKFYEMGYQTAVVSYTTNLLQMIPLKLQPSRI